MMTKEQMKTDIEIIKENLDIEEDDQCLESVYQLIQQIKKIQKTKKLSLMSQLRTIKKINAPVDFSENIDAYLKGEKQF